MTIRNYMVIKASADSFFTEIEKEAPAEFSAGAIALRLFGGWFYL